MSINGLNTLDKLLLLELVVILVVVLEIFNDEVDEHDVLGVRWQVFYQQIEKRVVEMVNPNQVACHHALYLLQLHLLLGEDHLLY